MKGKNRRFFEEKLVQNIKTALPAGSFEFVKRISGRILVKVEGAKLLPESCLKNVFGIAYFTFAQDCAQEMKEIKNKAFEMLKFQNFKTFKIACQRSKKDFVLTSTQVNEKVGAEIVKKLKKKVNLGKPDITLFIEIVEKYAFLYTKKIKGLGGLPVGVSGKAVVLLSGGIDSPVAAYLMLKRGVSIIFLHFHAYPYTNKASIEKVQKIVQVLSKFQPVSKLYLAPFADIQKQILLKTPARLRVVLYRRMMLRIAQKLSQEERALAIITGESVGQVASQTLENIGVIEKCRGNLSGRPLPILRPLSGQDKQEIIKIAEKIKTFEISILPDQDCCVRFVPKHPATKAKIEDVEEAEKKIDVKELVKICYHKIERI